jgi:macrolide-specific efflux system membrane fusion protein
MALDTASAHLAPDDLPLPPEGAESGGGTDPTSRRRRRRLQITLALVVVLVGATAIWWFALRDEGADTAAMTLTPQAVEVTTGTFGRTVSAEGTVAAADSEDLSFTSSGTVTAVNVAAGDSVVAGQVLATIDSADLAELVAAAEADLADAEAQLDDDSDQGASDEQLEADEAAVTTAEDALADAQESLEGATLVAGFDGLVTSVDLSVGEEVGGSGVGSTDLTGSGSGSGQSAGALGGADTTTGAAAAGGGATTTTSGAQISIVSAGSYEVELAVDTADIDEVQVGQEVELTISTDTAGTTTDTSGFPGGGPPGGFPGAQAQSGSADDTEEDGSDQEGSADDVTATGTVAEVGRVADASSGVANYRVLVTFAADAEQVWVGSAATAEIQVSTRTDVTQVSSRAVSTVDGESVVTVAVDGTADGATEQRPVELGETSGDMVEVVSGVEPGEFVIVEMPSFGGGGGGAQSPGGGEPPSGMELPAGAAQRGVAGTEEGS